MREILQTLKKNFPIVWDRYSRYNKQYSVFGWIHRPDGERDFILIIFIDGAKVDEIVFHTSSAKYSKAIADFLDYDHSDCIKVPEELR